ncbi:hypothetical protein N7532_002070 [Penicillium argentinense]|uniref:SET domain-containing protein n=1 Tax=Penicillium argentinense TaxID=1131581 RepID=A0A9W9G3N1_9EURO|nr:uncharacterized protein N7532_002070 [Penicillium argentinense]KAJ5111535.1 hypothetical protein N7532_002070 [Penicillium argentinense]
MSEVVYLTIESSTPIRVDAISQAQPDWIHPHLIQSADPVKGRQFRVSSLVPKGACLLVDRPYAIIPVVDEPQSSDNLICSNPACNNRAVKHAERLSCPNVCIPDVAWCSRTCQDTDKLRHDFECSWLKRYASSIRAKRGEYDFGMLWVIVRLLATRRIEMCDSAPINSAIAPNCQQSIYGWQGIEALCGSSDTWSHDQVRSWTLLVKKYLQNGPVLPHGLPSERILHLICQEEANSFGLYPRETGFTSRPESLVDRGEQFAASVYPTAAIANHSCVPNIIHKPDELGRMVFRASRDILAGEECCISYFDLTRFTDLESRREHLRKSFKFVCQCERCIFDEPVKETDTWDAMPLMDGF